jgi:hypothetical protein
MSHLERILRQIPAARERKNKNRAIGKVIQMKYKLNLTLDQMAEMVKEINSLDRELVKKKLRELGYR